MNGSFADVLLLIVVSLIHSIVISERVAFVSLTLNESSHATNVSATRLRIIFFIAVNM